MPQKSNGLDKEVTLVILPKDCWDYRGGYFKGNVWYPKVGYYYGYIEEKSGQDEQR